MHGGQGAVPGRDQADANLNRLLAWTREWVKGTGTKIPVTATGGGFYGPKYSDFYTYHSYRFGKQPLPNADGGPEHLCTETLNRPDKGLVDCLRGLAGKKNGFVVWDLMIGRDNCRFPWGHPDGPDEPAAPFHGVIYPDGHPWDVGEIEGPARRSRFQLLKEQGVPRGVFRGPVPDKQEEVLTHHASISTWRTSPVTGRPTPRPALARKSFRCVGRDASSHRPRAATRCSATVTMCAARLAGRHAGHRQDRPQTARSSGDYPAKRRAGLRRESRILPPRRRGEQPRLVERSRFPETDPTPGRRLSPRPVLQLSRRRARR